MTPRSVAILSRLATLFAVLAIVGAIAWNAWTFTQHRQARADFTAQPLERRAVARALPDAFAQQRASTQELKQSLSYGGALALGGAIVYGLGWAARRAAARRRETGGSNWERDDR